jgi:hypothetical protein
MMTPYLYSLNNNCNLVHDRGRLMFGYQVVEKSTGNKGFVASSSVEFIDDDAMVVVIYREGHKMKVQRLSELNLDPSMIVDEEEDSETAQIMSLVPDNDTTH